MEYEVTDTNYGVWTAVFSSFSFWVTVYFCMRTLRPFRSSEWICREVTFAHACSATAVSVYCAFTGPWPFTDPGGPNTPFQSLVITVSLGYFLFDLCWCLVHQTEGPVMLAHHALTCFGMFVSLGRNKCGTELVATLMGTEVTNPFLQSRWFLKESGRGKSLAFEINELTFLSLFTFVRLGAGSYLLYCYWIHPRPDYLGRIGSVTIYTIGWIFWVMMMKYAKRKYTGLYREYVSKKTYAKTKVNGLANGNTKTNGIHSMDSGLVNNNKRVNGAKID